MVFILQNYKNVSHALTVLNTTKVSQLAINKLSSNAATRSFSTIPNQRNVNAPNKLPTMFPKKIFAYFANKATKAIGIHSLNNASPVHMIYTTTLSCEAA